LSAVNGTRAFVELNHLIGADRQPRRNGAAQQDFFTAPGACAGSDVVRGRDMCASAELPIARRKTIFARSIEP
jgi:hypothetical protein